MFIYDLYIFTSSQTLKQSIYLLMVRYNFKNTKTSVCPKRIDMSRTHTQKEN